MSTDEDDSVVLADGKYTVIGLDDGHLRALRYGEPWRNLVGDNLVFELALRVQELEKKLSRARSDAAWAEFGDRQGGS